MQGTWVQSLGQKDPLETEKVTHSSILAQEILWREEPGGLPSMGFQKNRTWLEPLNSNNEVGVDKALQTEEPSMSPTNHSWTGLSRRNRSKPSQLREERLPNRVPSERASWEGREGWKIHKKSCSLKQACRAGKDSGRASWSPRGLGLNTKSRSLSLNQGKSHDKPISGSYPVPISLLCILLKWDGMVCLSRCWSFSNLQTNEGNSADSYQERTWGRDRPRLDGAQHTQRDSIFFLSTTSSSEQLLTH